MTQCQAMTDASPGAGRMAQETERERERVVKTCVFELKRKHCQKEKDRKEK